MAVLIKTPCEDILLINVCIPPPPPSSSYGPMAAIYQLDSYILETSLKIPCAEILLSGDFNARCGPDNNAVIASHLWSEGDNSDGSFTHICLSKDRVLNKAGAKLLHLARSFDLIPLNGTVPPVIPGEFTYLSSCGSSVVDYILVSPLLFNWVVLFEVGDQAFRDHLPLLFCLDIPQARKDCFISSSVESFPTKMGWKVKWSPDVERALNTLYSSAVGIELYNCVVQAPSGALAISCYEKLEAEVSQKILTTGQLHSFKRGRMNDSNEWFDSQCRDLFPRLRGIYREYRAGSNQVLPPEYFTTKKAYKICVRSAKSQAQKNIWRRLILATHNKDSGAFWHIISGSTYPRVLSVVPAPAWVAHFHAPFNGASASLGNDPSTPEKLPLWPPLTLDDIVNLVRGLKKRKAPGSDLIFPVDSIR
ncbi:uncharacterized protein LOC128353044 [Hemicordylus capensis]|uniref:uncharacterized protein LOC128353044 n=1 Tax=Hemicordylus capensis TaxID=884348 RepID=UPI0023040A8B|nr:uncharacterized protein LOC128353044 [Hemicordylus capensis]XP_053169689.1 uncharacterized protein LOC128353044 [Hemicordylus capensis]XP_053169690.1 uncharacterized protein LOC128353044 [Hemicordylus capensis]XP_053169691.1 uncharacterized protein LOC128353044 [Hemicordylus capensis]XP_053169692.1 uncharacterized protein LOC128353044 [Hemicordylus capensis]XP_053169694.1 uncharacterized protein LOC128353044 [Hemicordylus capensis]XP_053169695.1 uncharacterized protein LOC128353044 [Hemico